VTANAVSSIQQCQHAVLRNKPGPAGDQYQFVVHVDLLMGRSAVDRAPELLHLGGNADG
jgi:hypothetical protein